MQALTYTVSACSCHRSSICLRLYLHQEQVLKSFEELLESVSQPLLHCEQQTPLGGVQAALDAMQANLRSPSALLRQATLQLLCSGGGFGTQAAAAVQTSQADLGSAPSAGAAEAQPEPVPEADAVCSSEAGTASGLESQPQTPPQPGSRSQPQPQPQPSQHSQEQSAVTGPAVNAQQLMAGASPETEAEPVQAAGHLPGPPPRNSGLAVLQQWLDIESRAFTLSAGVRIISWPCVAVARYGLTMLAPLVCTKRTSV